MGNIAYLRVSTADQKTDRQLAGTNIEFERVFKEKISGKNRERPELQAMIDYARDGDTIHVHSLDRLGRSLRDLDDIVHELTDKGARVIFHKENMTFSNDEADPMSRFIFQIMGGFAEFERSLILSRQREGIDKKLAKGSYHDTQRKNIISEEKRNQVIKYLNKKKHNNSEIAKLTGISRGSVIRIKNSLITEEV